MAYTPGPWRVTGEYFHVVDSTNTVISISGVSMPCGYVPRTDPSYDNARLVAAAPELLDALKKTRQGYMNLIELKILPSAAYEDATREYIAVMDAAIAKAEGRA